MKREEKRCAKAHLKSPRRDEGRKLGPVAVFLQGPLVQRGLRPRRWGIVRIRTRTTPPVLRTTSPCTGEALRLRAGRRSGRDISRPYNALGSIFGERRRAAIYGGRRFRTMILKHRVKQRAKSNENRRSKAPPRNLSTFSLSTVDKKRKKCRTAQLCGTFILETSRNYLLERRQMCIFSASWISCSRKSG